MFVLDLKLVRWDSHQHAESGRAHDAPRDAAVLPA
jgi:hypothetical protein